MLSIHKSEAFQKEFQEWKKQVESITDLRIKSNLENLLLKLESSVKKLDNQLNEAVLNRQVKSMGTDHRDEVQELRKNIFTKLKDWKQANKV